MGFSEVYKNYKQNHNMTDEEIMKELDITPNIFYRLKKELNIHSNKRPRKNSVGFTEEMLQKGEANGLSRRLMYKRVREYDWSHQRAITEPVNIKMRRGLIRE